MPVPKPDTHGAGTVPIASAVAAEGVGAFAVASVLPVGRQGEETIATADIPAP
jgi:hypothetical protein